MLIHCGIVSCKECVTELSACSSGAGLLEGVPKMGFGPVEFYLTAKQSKLTEHSYLCPLQTLLFACLNFF